MNVTLLDDAKIWIFSGCAGHHNDELFFFSHIDFIYVKQWFQAILLVKLFPRRLNL